MDTENHPPTVQSRRDQLEEWKKRKQSGKFERIKSNRQSTGPRTVHVSERLLQPTESSKARQVHRENVLKNNANIAGARTSGRRATIKNQVQESGTTQSNHGNRQSQAHQGKKVKYVEARTDSGLRRKRSRVAGGTVSKDSGAQRALKKLRFTTTAVTKKDPQRKKIHANHTPKSKVTFMTPHKTKLTQAQMRAKLESWLEAKGKTPSRFKGLLSLPNTEDTEEKKKASPELSREADTFTESDEIQEDKDIKDSSSLLQECLVLLDTGCPAETISTWLDAILKKDPQVQKQAFYWILRVKILQEHASYDDVVRLFEQAVEHNAQPQREVSAYLKEYIRENKSTHPESPNTPVSCMQPMVLNTPRSNTPVACIQPLCLDTPRPRTHVEETNIFQSSAIKFLLSQGTPFRSRSIKTPGGHLAVVTPVRRSTRSSLISLPAMFKDHETILNSLDDLSPATRDGVSYQTNQALQAIASPPLIMPTI